MSQDHLTSKSIKQFDNIAEEGFCNLYFRNTFNCRCSEVEGPSWGVISVLFLMQWSVPVHSQLSRRTFGLTQYSCSFTLAVLNGLLFLTFQIPKCKIIMFPKLLLRKA